ncbi:uncharacterized protein EV420DRAFT_1138043 [Desarmillaria tabescens]|uniref:Uncharacterized protein n=1 Tax=Armillaria tabescens TaxID=1929756 RepID=A0AA39JE10_ARMTA|nr:uncharacterized protein EV420DRAFT_1138043 [Desarmillaria tabescens]KAK0440036.1 hypothetical protein EV420DRAFT_1138043 [Desarmillaria tabescens]
MTDQRKASLLPMSDVVADRSSAYYVRGLFFVTPRTCTYIPCKVRNTALITPTTQYHRRSGNRLGTRWFESTGLIHRKIDHVFSCMPWVILAAVYFLSYHLADKKETLSLLTLIISMAYNAGCAWFDSMGQLITAAMVPFFCGVF